MRPLVFALSAIGSLSLSIPSGFAQTLPFPENSTFFTGQPPSLVTAETPDSRINWPDAHYYFTFDLPKNSVQSLGKVTIQPQPNVQTIQFNLANTTAFQGTQNSQGKAFTLKASQDPKTQAIAITFDPPIPPGTAFSIRLEANQNPSVTGTYLFSVKTFPAGPNPIGFDMGVGRLSFYQNF
jgi:hypothetical protein